MKDFNPFDAIYCINLKIRPDRKEKMKKEFKKLRIKNVIWYDAIYGKKLNLDTIPDNIISKFGKYVLTKNEIGCAFSHIGVWKHIIKNNYKTALIFEDDIISKTDMFKTLKQTWKYLPKNWDVLYLGKIDSMPYRKKIINKYFEHPGRPTCMHAYCIKKSSAIELLKKCLPLKFPIDSTIGNQVNNLKLVAFRKNIFDQKLLNSDIHDGRYCRNNIGYVIIGLALILIIFYWIKISKI